MDTTSRNPFPDGEHEIILIGIERNSYFLYRGEEHLNQVLLADGVFPKPILCLHFESTFDANIFMGEGISQGAMWAIHPEIVARLRADDHLVETDA